INSAPRGLDDVTSYPLITQALLKRGYTAKQVTNILGGNILRVLKANEQGTELAKK
ncbi:MAG: membrane dipeptidase, partial [Sediminibacterium sp.]|nr:membrane dipeptidase [Sediminibacterium sp.]